MAETMAKLALPWAIAVRTRVYDELILGEIEQDKATAVVNLAAGLDTRPYRLELPRSIHWIELDFPGVIEPKQAALAGERTFCEVERIGLDLAKRGALNAVLERVVSQHSSVVVVTEGLLLLGAIRKRPRDAMIGNPTCGASTVGEVHVIPPSVGSIRSGHRPCWWLPGLRSARATRRSTRKRWRRWLDFLPSRRHAAIVALSTPWSYRCPVFVLAMMGI